jgi:hypothetical protein
MPGASASSQIERGSTRPHSVLTERSPLKIKTCGDSWTRSSPQLNPAAATTTDGEHPPWTKSPVSLATLCRLRRPWPLSAPPTMGPVRAGRQNQMFVTKGPVRVLRPRPMADGE